MTERGEDQPEREELSARALGEDAPLVPGHPGAGTVRATWLEFSGPLPPPHILAQYNDALPDGAERIVRLTENQTEHRQRLETRGQLFTFILALVALAGGILLIILGHSAEGLVPVISAVVGLGRLFIYREVTMRKLSKALSQ